jgi:carnitine O-acetyltransferase
MPTDNEYAHIGLSSSSSSPEFAHRKTSNRTLAFQDKLPKLPIPFLEDTCNRYLRALEALQDEKEHANTKAAVKQFLETDGPGPVLHRRLEEYAKDKARFVLLSHMSSLFTDCGSSYIEEFWCDTFISIS